MPAPLRLRHFPARTTTSACGKQLYQGSRYVHRLFGSGEFDINGWDGDNEISSVINMSKCSVTLFNNDTAASSTRSWSLGSQSHQDLTQVRDRNGVNADNDAESYRVAC